LRALPGQWKTGRAANPLAGATHDAGSVSKRLTARDWTRFYADVPDRRHAAQGLSRTFIRYRLLSQLSYSH